MNMFAGFLVILSFFGVSQGIQYIHTADCGVPGFEIQKAPGTVKCETNRSCVITQNMPLKNFPECVKDLLIDGTSQVKIQNNCTCDEGSSRTPATEKSISRLLSLAADMFKNRRQKCSHNLDHVQINAKSYKCGKKDGLIESVYMEYCHEDYIIQITNSVPVHCHMDGIWQGYTPYAPCERYLMMIKPQKNPGGAIEQNFIEAGFGANGFARSGCFVFGPLNAEVQCDAAAMSESFDFDPYCGHTDPQYNYHYHKVSVAFKDYDNCALIGFYEDGAPVHGLCTVTEVGKQIKMTSCYEQIEGTNGCSITHYKYNGNKKGCNLDMANGYTFKDTTTTGNPNITFQAGDYAHFYTETYPYTIPGFFPRHQGGVEPPFFCELEI